MTGFTFFNALFGILIPTLLAVYAAFLARRANKIAEESDRKMTVIADSKIDEALAIMAEHLKATQANKRFVEALGLGGSYITLIEIRQITSNFNAASDLKEYAHPTKKKALITEYIIPILEDLYYIKNAYIQAHLTNEEWQEITSADWNNALNEIVETALAYDIEIERIIDIYQRFKGSVGEK